MDNQCEINTISIRKQYENNTKNMFKKLSKIIAVIIILFFLPLVNVLASGKMEVKIGEKVMLQGDNVKTGSTYKWIVKKGREIVSTQSSPIFNYTFLQQGEFDVNLTITDSLNNTTNTSIYVLAGDKYSRSTAEGGGISPDDENTPLAISYSTLPPVGSDGAVHLIGDSKVMFSIVPTRSDIIEYRIDRNIFEDSDGNGKANDDIDNSGDDSYLLGGSWDTQYREGESTKTVAELTLVTKTGEKTKSQIEIVFDQGPKREGDPSAILGVTPSPNPGDQLVYLYDDTSSVGFYSRLSEGNIIEYRIDKNIFEDSDGDGNPSNDIDNVNDISFKTGDVWTTEYENTDEQIIAQLIVVGEGGKGSRVQRGFWFSDSPRPPTIIEVKGDIQLVADKSFVLNGDPITFTIEGLKQTLDNYTFSWDFDGDGIVDKDIEFENTVSHIYDYAEFYTASVIVTDIDDISAEFTLDILVKDIIGTVSDFEYEIDGNNIQFINLSTAASNLTNNNLDYTWSFGDTDPDNYEDQKNQIGQEDPIYTYSKAGAYIVTLTIVDADNVIDTKTAEIIIEGALLTGEEIADGAQEVADSSKEGGSIIIKILKVILYLILIVVALGILIIVGFLSFLKLQNPDLIFEELIDELKIKMLGKLGVHDMVEPETIRRDDDTTKRLDDAVVSGAAVIDSEPVESVEEKVPIEGEVVEAPLAQETGPVPDWMKGASDENALDEDLTDSKLENINPKSEELIPEPQPISVEDDSITSENMAKDLIGDSEDDEDDEDDDGDYENEDDEDNDITPPIPPAPPAPLTPEEAPSISDQNGPVPDWLKGA